MTTDPTSTTTARQAAVGADTAGVRRDHAAGEPDITSYPADERFPGRRPAVLVLPGGGYRFHTEHEGEGYARWLSGIGLHAFVLRYPLMTDHRFPAPLESGRAALEWIRSGKHGLDVGERVGVIGSSAGGHLAGLILFGKRSFPEQDQRSARRIPWGTPRTAETPIKIYGGPLFCRMPMLPPYEKRPWQSSLLDRV